MSSGFLSTILVSLVVVVGIPSCHCQNDYQTCRQPFDCGSLTNLKYPFYGGSRPSSCGVPGFSLTCQGQGAPFINISSIIYRVLSINDQNQTLRVARNDLWSNVCAPSVVNITLENTPFTFDSTSVNISLIYRCTGPISAPTVLPHQFDCTTNGNGATSGLGFFIIESSSGTQVNVSSTGFTCTGPQITSRIDQAAALGLGTTPSPTLMQASLQNGFSIQWSAENQNCQSCVGSGGTCVFDQTTTSFACYCADGTLNSTCTSTSNQNGLSSMRKQLITGVLVGVLVLGISSIIGYYFAIPYISACLEKKSNPHVEKFLLTHGSLAQKRYTYYEIKKMTKSFKDKLGQGGFGIVYKGELPDGQPVAVKVLTQAHKDAENFFNEIASISRTSHVNIVNLLGFCYGKKKRALVYEYMPNKSLDKFLFAQGSISPECSLESDKLHAIAVGVAQGLEYLHRGCNTRIVHFDIKPQNILLDEDYSPKISDFGLAKLFKKKQSAISMLEMRGTIGYIAPEVFSRNFGAVSDKSDVYSYGMMLVAMTNARKVVEIEPIQSSGSYFHDTIYEILSLKMKNIDDVARDEKEENEIKMLKVGLWCIQTAPSDRPSISKVLEMLQGSVQSIPIPPKPVFPSIATTAQFSSSTNFDIE